MARLFRILVRTLSGVVALILLAVWLVYYLAGQSLPDFDKDLRVAGITSRVEILRDNHAIPHIFSQNEADVFFGLGYAHAEDRLWQMLMMRRMVQGHLSEMFGRRALKRDELMRTLGLYTIAHQSLEFQTPQARAVLEAYAAGVNARLKTVHDQALGRGAPELFLFSREIAPWTPTDSLAVMRLMAFDLTDMAQREILQARLLRHVRHAQSFDEERLKDLFPDEQGKPIIALPDFAEMAPPATPTRAARAGLFPAPGIGEGWASNAFAAAPGRSAAGATLLATDPHLALTAPGIWMLARVELASGGAIGATIPGIPAIIIGRNARFGWGTTNSYLDNQDIYVEKIKPNDPDFYLTPAGFRQFESREEIIAIDGAEDETITIRASRHGPVIDRKHWGLAGILQDDGSHVAALAWAGFNPDDQSIDSLLGLMRAQSVDEGRTALEGSKILSLNVVMADETSIALQATGRAPARREDHLTQGRLPASGWLFQNDWNGFLPFESNPFVKDPASGIIVNTNNRLTDEAFPNHWSFDYGDDQRILRAELKLNEREFHTLDSFIGIQTDIVSPSARVILPLIGRDLWFDDRPAAEGTVERRRQTALKLLGDWSGEMTEHDPEPLIFAAWIRELQNRLLRDEFGRLAEEIGRVRPLFIERVFRDVEGAGAWCDVIQTLDRAESCTEIARDALDAALQFLVEHFGDRIESWRWGGIHQATHKHQVLGNNRLFSWFVNIEHDTPGGDNTLLRGQTQGDGDNPFLNVHAAGFRAVYDFSDPESSVFIIATGQSGHPLSRHYDDLAQLWRRSEYIPMTLNPILARGGSVGVTVLLPEGGE